MRIFALNEHHLLDDVDSIKVPYGVDNISVDKNGDLYAASFPQAYKWMQSSKKPFDVNCPSTIFKIHKGEAGWKVRGEKKRAVEDGEYEIEKVVEDDGSTLPGSTIAVHDVETGRIFLGGAMSPYITICETR